MGSGWFLALPRQQGHAQEHELPLQGSAGFDAVQRQPKANGVPSSAGRRLPNLAMLYGRGSDRYLYTSSTESQQPLNPSHDSRDSSMGPRAVDPAIFTNRT